MHLSAEVDRIKWNKVFKWLSRHAFLGQFEKNIHYITSFIFLYFFNKKEKIKYTDL